jgi:hypothetical protein
MGDDSPTRSIRSSCRIPGLIFSGAGDSSTVSVGFAAVTAALEAGRTGGMGIDAVGTSSLSTCAPFLGIAIRSKLLLDVASNPHYIGISTFQLDSSQFSAYRPSLLTEGLGYAARQTHSPPSRDRQACR